MAQSGYRVKVNKGRPRRRDPHARRRCTWLQPNSEATPSKTQRSGRSTWKRDVAKESHSDSPREHRTIGERSLSVFLMLTLFYDFHLIIVRTTLIRRLRKTRTTSKNCKTGCELERDELYRLYYTRYHAIRYEIKQPVHEKNERSFDQLIDHVRTLHIILHQTVFWFSTRWKLRQLAHEKWDHVDTESKRRRGALGEAILMQGEELDCKRIQGRDSRRLSRMWSCWACENLRIKRACKQTRNESLRERSALSSEK